MSKFLRSAKILFHPKANLDRLAHASEYRGEAPAMARSRLRLRHITSNYPLIIGGLIVLGLFLVVLFGPLWAPINPYIAGQHVVPHFDPQSGEWIDPPLNPRMLLVILGVAAATVYIIGNTGPAPWLAKMANAFSGGDAYLHTQTLAEINGRSPNQAGSEEAAAYIAQKFEGYGLQPGWKHLEYIYPMVMTLTEPLTQPQLELVGSDGTVLQAFAHQLDFGFMIEGHGGSGDVDLPLTFVGFASEGVVPDWESYQGLDLRDRIVLLLEGNAPEDFALEALVRGAQGVLWIASGDDSIRSQIQFGPEGSDMMRFPQLPTMRISSNTADAILETLAVSKADLFAADGLSQTGPGWFTRDLNGATVHMSLELDEPREVSVPTILGYLPGSDLNLAGELVIIYAFYEGLGTDPDGTVYPVANHNASAVGVLLEAARLWQEESLDPRRPVLFAAWGAGTLDYPKVI